MLSREHNPNILVVDDEPFIVRYVQQVLQRANYRVLTATNAEEAWSIFERRRTRIDLLLTDIVMPGLMDGLELAAKIRRFEPTFPILLITGAIFSSDPRAMEIKEDLLRKPFSPKQLIDFVGAQFARESPIFQRPSGQV